MGHIQFIEMLVPLGASNRPGKIISPTYITIHETSLGTLVEPEYKNIEHYILFMMAPPISNPEIAYHYLVSDDTIIRFIPDNELAYHARGGNFKSIGIERLVHQGLDFYKAIDNQALLTATLMNKLCIPLEKVVPHKFWQGKECPARLLAGLYGGWSGFVNRVNFFYANKQFIIELL